MAKLLQASNDEAMQIIYKLFGPNILVTQYEVKVNKIYIDRVITIEI